MHRTTLAALALLAVTPALAVPPPPTGYYGGFREMQISCRTETDTVAVFDAMAGAKSRDELAAAIAEATKANDCGIGFLPGAVAVGESNLRGKVGDITFYSVHVGNSDGEWWLLYGDVPAATN